MQFHLGRLPLLLLLPGGAAGSLAALCPRRVAIAVRLASVRLVKQPQEVPSFRQAAAVCNVSPSVIRRWLSLGLIPGPPWTEVQLQKARNLADPQARRRGTRAAHGTMTRWNAGCSCAQCRNFQSDAARARACQAQRRLPIALRQQLLEAIYAGQSFRAVLRDLGLTSSQVWGSSRPTRTGQRSWKLLFGKPSGRPPARHQRRPRGGAVFGKTAVSTSASGWGGSVPRLPTLTATGSVSLAKDDRHQAEEREPRRGQIGPHRLQVAGMACQRKPPRAGPSWGGPPSCSRLVTLGRESPEGQAVRLLRFWLDV